MTAISSQEGLNQEQNGKFTVGRFTGNLQCRRNWLTKDEEETGQLLKSRKYWSLKRHTAIICIRIILALKFGQNICIGRYHPSFDEVGVQLKKQATTNGI